MIGGRWGDVRRLAAAAGVAVSEAAVRACVSAGGRPRYNWSLNEDNPRQVPRPLAVEQRWARDDAFGRPRWVPLEDRPPAGAVAPGPAGLRPAWWRRSRWTGWHVTVPAWAVLSALAWGYVRVPWVWFWAAVDRPQVGPWSPLLAAVLGWAALAWAVSEGGRWWRRRSRGPWWWPR